MTCCNGQFFAQCTGGASTAGAVPASAADTGLGIDGGSHREMYPRLSSTINEAHKQYSLLDTIFNYIFYLGPPGKHLYLSTQNQLHVGRRSRPTCTRFS